MRVRLKVVSLGLCAAALAALGPVGSAAELTDTGVLSAYRAVHMQFDSSSVTSKERKVIDKLVEATRYLDDVYWAQSDPEGLRLYHSLAGRQDQEDQELRRRLRINGGGPTVRLV